ncbi:MFS general substrate transporter [Xylariaceae sp. FL1272]|nr:MFS general substrate transporter [Xylariaceae sp. FL1272]
MDSKAPTHVASTRPDSLAIVASPSPPPDGGSLAWLHVLGGFMLFFNSWGLLTTFGVFQTYYESGALFTESSTNISWVGSILSFSILLAGVFAGPIYDRGHLRLLLVIGTIGVVLGNMFLSLCQEWWQVLLAQGFFMGLGAGCLFIPVVSILPTYFCSRLALAVGIASSGSSLGGVIYPIVLNNLIVQIGFPWAVRTIGFIALATLLIPLSVMKLRFVPAKPRAVFDWAAFAEFDYVMHVIATTTSFFALAILTFYVSYYAQNLGITDTSLSFYIVAIFNAGSVAGRIIPNAISDKVGPFNIVAPGTAITGTLMFAMPSAKTPAAVTVLAVLLGFSSGILLAVPPVCFAFITKDRSRLGTRVGQGYAVTALGLLAGGPAGGAILGDEEVLHWHRLWYTGGATAVGAGVLYGVIRVYRAGWKLNVKA